VSNSLGNLAIVSGANTSYEVPNDGVKAILIGNESGLTVTITMESGGVQKTLYPGLLDWFPVKKGFTGLVKIAPITILGNVASWPSSSLVFDVVGMLDTESQGTYPIALPRQTVGNVVTAQVSNTVPIVMNMPGVVLVGTTSGTVTLWQWLTGDFLYTDLFFNGYKNASAPNQTIAPPIAYTSLAMVSVGGIAVPNSSGIFKFTSGGITQNVNVPSAVGGGGHNTVTRVQSFTPMAEVSGGFDTIFIDGSYTGTATGWVHIVGI
jgi:hypothetical protein